LVTTAPAGAFANNSSQFQALGRSGEQLSAEVHGIYYTANYGNRVFIAATAAAGTTIPVQASNLVSTFTLLNPLGSNVNLELIDYALGITNATTVVASIDLYYQSGVGSSSAALTSTTAITIRPAVLGGPGVSQAQAFSAATFTNTVGTNFFRIAGLTSFGAVTTTNAGPIVRSFNGSIILGPGTAVTVAGTAAQGQPMTQTISWAEWPV
jgi:hypothetical protein